LDLRKLDIAVSVMMESEKLDDSTDSQSKWRRLGDLALSYGNVELAKKCADRSSDLSGLLLLYSAAGDADGMRALAGRAREAGRSNVAFLAYFVTNQLDECIQLLIETNRVPEAAFFARTYLPSRISRCVCVRVCVFVCRAACLFLRSDALCSYVLNWRCVHLTSE